jgi:GNAT superfamily N-acetyltransferase
MSEAVTVRRVSADEAASRSDALVMGLAEVLIDCVEGGASVSFMLPLPHEKAAAFWHGVVADVANGNRALLLAEDANGRILGTAQLILSLPDNQPHRADVAKVLVHRTYRRRGIADRLMRELEEVARAEKRSVLVLDTVTGGDAERVYERTGWQRVGAVPMYALMPDGSYCGTTFYFKHI